MYFHRGPKNPPLPPSRPRPSLRLAVSFLPAPAHSFNFPSLTMAAGLSGMFGNQAPVPPPPPPPPPPPVAPGGQGLAGLLPPNPAGPRNPIGTLVDDLEASFEVGPAMRAALPTIEMTERPSLEGNYFRPLWDEGGYYRDEVARQSVPSSGFPFLC